MFAFEERNPLHSRNAPAVVCTRKLVGIDADPFGTIERYRLFQSLPRDVVVDRFVGGDLCMVRVDDRYKYVGQSYTRKLVTR